MNNPAVPTSTFKKFTCRKCLRTWPLIHGITDMMCLCSVPMKYYRKVKDGDGYELCDPIDEVPIDPGPLTDEWEAGIRAHADRRYYDNDWKTLAIRSLLDELDRLRGTPIIVDNPPPI